MDDGNGLAGFTAHVATKMLSTVQSILQSSYRAWLGPELHPAPAVCCHSLTQGLLQGHKELLQAVGLDPASSGYWLPQSPATLKSKHLMQIRVVPCCGMPAAAARRRCLLNR